MKRTRYQGLLWFLFILIVGYGCNSSYRVDLNELLETGRIPKIKESKLIQVSSHDTSGGNNDKIVIPSGATKTIADVSGPGVIVRIWMALESNDPYYLRRVLIRMYWDEEEDPSVEVPLGDFFGSGFAYKQYTTPYISMSSGGFTCFFPMPFEEHAKIEIVNETNQEIPAFYYQIEYQKLEKPIDRDIGYFHAQWNRNIRTNYDSSYTILNAKGRGQVVGVNMSIQSYDRDFSFLEGDEKVFVDGEKKPSIYGTGTEDYFSAGWYFSKGEYAGPYNGLVVKDDSLTRISAYRFHIPDQIPFKKAIKFTIEHGHGNTSIADYSSTVYWYQLEPHKKFPPMPKAGLRIPLRSVVPNRLLEAEEMKFSLGKTPSKIEEMSNYGPEWSGEKQLLIESKLKDEFTWVLPELKENMYNIDIYYSKGPNYGDVEVIVNNKIVGVIKGYSNVITHGGCITIKNIENPGTIMGIRFRVIGKDTYSKGYFVGLDGVKLNPKRRFIPQWMIAGPFSNIRVSADKRKGLDSVFTIEKQIDLNTIYPGAGGRLVKWNLLETPENGFVNLAKEVTPHELVITYALTYIYAKQPETVSLFIGSDDGSKVFFNNRQLYRFDGLRVAEPDQAEILLNVNPGWNKLLLKLENNLGGYGFYARLNDRDSSLILSPNQQTNRK